MRTYTREKNCVLDAEDEFYKTKQPQLIFKKGRKYIHVTGELRQDSKESFKTAFGEVMYYSEDSNIVKEYKLNGYELRGWINSDGSFKNN